MSEQESQIRIPYLSQQKDTCFNFQERDNLQNVSSKEVKDSIQVLQSKLPHYKIQDVVQKLYQRCVKNYDPLSQRSDSDIFQDEVKFLNVSTQISQKEKKNNKKKDKQSEKIVIAKALVNVGYGHIALDKEISNSKRDIVIERSRYKILASEVASEAFLKLQQFIIKDCQINIKRLSPEQIKSITIALLNCRKVLEEQSIIFLKFVSLAYEIESVLVTQEQAIALYASITKLLKSKIGEMQLIRLNNTVRVNHNFRAKRSNQSEVFQIHRIWTPQLEDELLEVYKRFQHYVKIRDHFKSKYPQNQHLFTIQSLKSKFLKIMRLSLRKLNCFIEKFGNQRIPSLIKLSDINTKILLRAPEAFNARILLIEIYLRDSCDLKRLFQTVNSINQFLIMKNSERINQGIEAQPLIDSANKKIDYNLQSISQKLRQPKNRNSNINYSIKKSENNYNHFVDPNNNHYFRKASDIHEEISKKILSTDIFKEEEVVIEKEQLASQTLNEIQQQEMMKKVLGLIKDQIKRYSYAD